MAYQLSVTVNAALAAGATSRIRAELQKALTGIGAVADVRVNPAAATQLQAMSRSAQGLNQQFVALTGSSAASAASADRAAAAYSRVTTQARTASAAVGSLGSSTKAITAAHRDAADAAFAFGSQVGLAARRFAAYSAGTVAIFGIVNALKTGLSEAVKFDLQMNKLAQVADEGARGVAALRSTVIGLSKELGVSSADLADAAVAFTQAGLRASDAKVAVEAFAKTMLSANFGSAKQTVEGVIAVYQQFGQRVDRLQEQLGAMNAVAGAFAVEAGDLVTAVQKAGGAFSTAGGSLNELLALMTAVRATTRESADQIATGLRSIFTYVQRDSTVEALKAFNINLRYTREEADKLAKSGLGEGLENQFVGPYQAILRLSKGLAGLRSTDPRYSQIVEDLGGVRQISRVLPLIQQVGVAQRALNVARLGEAQLEAQAAIRQDAIATRLTKIKEAFGELTKDLVANQGFKAFIQTLTELSDTFAGLLKNIGPVIPSLAAFAVARAAASAIPFGAGFAQSFSNRGAAPRRFAVGGVVPGEGRGDKVPAMLEPKEFVLRREAAQQIGYDRLSRWNRGETPRFATGGPVSAPRPTHPLIAFNTLHPFYAQRFIDRVGFDPQKLVGRFYTGDLGEHSIQKGLPLQAVYEHRARPRDSAIGVRGNTAVEAGNLFHELGHAVHYRGLKAGNMDLVLGANMLGARFAEVDLVPKFRGVTDPGVLKYISSPEEGFAQLVSNYVLPTREHLRPGSPGFALLKEFGDLLPRIHASPVARPFLGVQDKGVTAEFRHRFGFARGGSVPPHLGTPGQDSVNALLMPDEYVLRTSSARKLGRARLDYMNQTGEIPRFADGGPVNPTPAGRGRRVETEEQKLARTMARFEQAMVRFGQLFNVAAPTRGDLGRLGPLVSAANAKAGNTEAGLRSVINALVPFSSKGRVYEPPAGQPADFEAFQKDVLARTIRQAQNARVREREAGVVTNTSGANVDNLANRSAGAETGRATGFLGTGTFGRVRPETEAARNEAEEQRQRRQERIAARVEAERAARLERGQQEEIAKRAAAQVAAERAATRATSGQSAVERLRAGQQRVAEAAAQRQAEEDRQRQVQASRRQALVLAREVWERPGGNINQFIAEAGGLGLSNRDLRRIFPQAGAASRRDQVRVNQLNQYQAAERTTAQAVGFAALNQQASKTSTALATLNVALATTNPAVKFLGYTVNQLAGTADIAPPRGLPGAVGGGRPPRTPPRAPGGAPAGGDPRDPDPTPTTFGLRYGLRGTPTGSTNSQRLDPYTFQPIPVTGTGPSIPAGSGDSRAARRTAMLAGLPPTTSGVLDPEVRERERRLRAEIRADQQRVAALGLATRQGSGAAPGGFAFGAAIPNLAPTPEQLQQQRAVANAALASRLTPAGIGGTTQTGAFGARLALLPDPASVAAGRDGRLGRRLAAEREFNYNNGLGSGVGAERFTILAERAAQDDIRRRGVNLDRLAPNAAATLREERIGDYQQRLARAIDRQLASVLKNTSVSDRYGIAVAAAEKAFRENQRVLVDRRGNLLGLASLGDQIRGADTRTGVRRFLGGEVDAAGRDRFTRAYDYVSGGPGRPTDPNDPRRPGFFRRFLGGAALNPTGLAYSGSFVLPLVGERFAASNESIQTAATTGATGRVYAQNAATAGFQGAGVGLAAAAGLGLTGPALPVVALAAGAAFLVSSLRDTARQINDARLGQAVQSLNDRFQVLLRGGRGLQGADTAAILGDISAARSAAAVRAAQENSGFLGFNSAGFAAASTRETRAALGPQAGLFVQVLSDEAVKLARRNRGAEPRDVVAQLGRGLPGELARVVADVRQVPVAKVLAEFTQTVRDAQEAAKVEDDFDKMTQAAQKVAASFDRLAVVTTNAAAAVEEGRPGLDAIGLAFGGQVPNLSNRAGAFDRLGGQNAAGVDAGLGVISRAFGADAAPFVDRVRSAGQVLDALPAVLRQLTASGFATGDVPEQRVRDLLEARLFPQLRGVRDETQRRQVLDANPELRTALEFATGGVNASLRRNRDGDPFRDFRADPAAFSDRLFRESVYAQGIQQGNQVTSTVTQTLQSFLGGLAQVRANTTQINDFAGREADQRLVTRRFEADARAGGADGGRFLSLQELQRPFLRRQQSLLEGTGLAADDEIGIAARLAERRAAIPGLFQRVNANQGGADSPRLAREFDAVVGEADRLQQALKNLADPTSRLAAIQERLAALNADREGRLGFAERFLTADAQERFRLTRGQALARRVTDDAASFDRLSDPDRRLAIEGLRLVGNTAFQDGRTGNQVLEQLLARTGILNPRAEAERNQALAARGQISDRAENAQSLLAEGLRQENQKFLDKLLALQTEFFRQLNVGALDQRRGERETRLNEAVSREGTLRGRQSGFELLRSVGITTQEQLDNARGLAERGQIDSLRAINSGRLPTLDGGYLDAASARQNRTDISRAVAAGSDAVRTFINEDTGRPFGARESDSAALVSSLLQNNELVNSLPAGERAGLLGAVSRDFRSRFNSRLTEFSRESPGEAGGVLRRRAIEAALTSLTDRELEARAPAAFRERVTRTGALAREQFTPLGVDAAAVQRLSAADATRLNDLLRNGFRPGAESLRPFDTFQTDLDKAAGTTRDLTKEFEALQEQLRILNRQTPAKQDAAAGALGFGLGFASGGRVLSGPTGTDTIPAYLSPNEFVVNARDARRHGPLLEAINSGRLPPAYGFQTGGPVPPQPPPDTWRTRAAGAYLASVNAINAGIRWMGFQEGGPVRPQQDGWRVRAAGAYISSMNAINSAVKWLGFADGGRIPPFVPYGVDRFRQLPATGPSAPISGFVPYGLEDDPRYKAVVAAAGFASMRGRRRAMAGVRANTLTGLAFRQALASAALYPGEDAAFGAASQRVGSADEAYARRVARQPRFATGGMVPGFGGADNTPLLARGGEFILNRRAVDAVGATALSRLNSNPGAQDRAESGEQFGRLGQAMTGFNAAAAPLTSALTTFGDASRALSEALNNFPRTVEHSHRVEQVIVLNDGGLLQSLRAENQQAMAEYVTRAVDEAITRRLPDAPGGGYPAG